MRQKLLYRHNGYEYRPEILEDLDEDTYTVRHLVENMESGKTIEVNFTPFHSMSRVDFQNWVDLGCKNYEKNGFWTPMKLREARKSMTTSFGVVKEQINKPSVTKSEKKVATRKTRNPRMS